MPCCGLKQKGATVGNRRTAESIDMCVSGLDAYKLLGGHFWGLNSC